MPFGEPASTTDQFRSGPGDQHGVQPRDPGIGGRPGQVDLRLDVAGHAAPPDADLRPGEPEPPFGDEGRETRSTRHPGRSPPARFRNRRGPRPPPRSRFPSRPAGRRPAPAIERRRHARHRRAARATRRGQQLRRGRVRRDGQRRRRRGFREASRCGRPGAGRPGGIVGLQAERLPQRVGEGRRSCRTGRPAPSPGPWASTWFTAPGSSAAAWSAAAAARTGGRRAPPSAPRAGTGPSRSAACTPRTPGRTDPRGRPRPGR